jgi:two-component system, chemotaxis family, chemotaxis protein CheY
MIGGDRMFEQSELRVASQADSTHADGVRRTPPRLLVIDDDNLHRMIICRAAAKAGYVPAGAATYDEAAQLVRDSAFDCITLDLSLGDHVGVDMLRHLWVIGCKAPIIIVSGCDNATCSESEKVAESLKLNVWESIPKPVDLAVLRESLERLKASWDEPAADAPPAVQLSPA